MGMSRRIARSGRTAAPCALTEVTGGDVRAEHAAPSAGNDAIMKMRRIMELPPSTDLASQSSRLLELEERADMLGLDTTTALAAYASRTLNPPPTTRARALRSPLGVRTRWRRRSARQSTQNRALGARHDHRRRCNDLRP